MKKKKKTIKKLKIKNLILLLILLLAIITLIISGYKIITWFIDNARTEKQAEDIFQETEITEVDDKKTENLNPPEDTFDPYWDYIKIPLISVNFNNLLETNSDTVGWISVNGTNINYPVVQAENNDFYLNHSFNKSYNDAGWVFMDYRNNSTDFNKNTIIYAHSRYDKSMFGSLRNITKNNWYNDTDNYIIKFSTPTKNTLWQVFSTYTIEAESYYITTDFEEVAQYQTWLDEMLNRSVFDFHTTVNPNDKILTLSSCYTSDGIRVVLHAKLIKQEIR